MFEIIKNISAIVGCVSAIIALTTTIIKPFRQGVANFFAKRAKEKNQDDKIDSMDKKIDKLLATNTDLDNRLTRVETNVLRNEADRLRTELFDCGNRCRRDIRLHPEEMAHIREVYKKYSEELKQNGPGEREYNFICDYYNHQKFPEYHYQNK